MKERTVEKRLSELMLEKERLEAEIMRLKREGVKYGKVRISKATPYDVSEHWSLSYHAKVEDGRRIWRPLFSDKDRDEVIKAIPGIISDMQEVYNIATAEDDDNGEGR